MRYWFGLTAFAALAAGLASSGNAQDFERHVRHSQAPCQGSGPAVRIQVTGISTSTGNLRIQLYRGLAGDWLEQGRWLNRIEIPARAGNMTICMPVPQPGDYAIAIRHDANNNNDTDISVDGGGMSNNPPLNIFNLGRPSIERTRFEIGRQVLPMTIRMRYL